MLGTFFSFRGRIGRLAYFGSVLAAGLIAGVGFAILIVMGFSAGLAKGTGGAIVGTSVAVLIGFLGLIPFTWASLALAAKRLRDAGFPPLVVIPAMIAFSLFDVLVLSRHSAGHVFGGFHLNSPVGLMVNLAYGLVLLFWPSADGTGHDDVDGGTKRLPGESSWHERALIAASSPLPVQIADPSPSQMPSPSQPRTFGRRGL